MTLILPIYLEKIHREENPVKIATRVPMPVKKITGYNCKLPLKCTATLNCKELQYSEEYLPHHDQSV